MKAFVFLILFVFYSLTPVGCQRKAPLTINNNAKDKPLLVRPNLKPLLVSPLIKKEKDWSLELEKGLVNFEGFRSQPYYCCAGVLTIGYGCTDSKITKRKSITEKEARVLLLQEVERVKLKVQKEVNVKLSENQLNALTSFAFNCGMSNLRKLVNGHDRLNSGNYKSIEKVLPLYRKAGGKIREGLEKRRAWEIMLWKGEA